MRLTVVKSALGLALWAALHSALATSRAKMIARAWLGERRANGVYRFVYNSVAVFSLGALLRSLWRLPDRRLYTVRGRPRALMLGGQALCLVVVVGGALRIGVGLFSGLTPLRDLLLGRAVSSAPVAQHPLVEADEEIRWGGPWRLSRHPLNYFVLIGYWLSPAMTVKWAAFGLATAVYMALGSLHEERLLEGAYGERYRRYKERAPHLLVAPGRLAGWARVRLSLDAG